MSKPQQDADGNYPCAHKKCGCSRVFGHAPASIAHSKGCKMRPADWQITPAAEEEEDNAPPRAPPEAYADWETIAQPLSGKVYYYHAKTGRTSPAWPPIGCGPFGRPSNSE